MFCDLILALPVVDWLFVDTEDQQQEQASAMLCRRRCLKKVDNVEEEHAQVTFLDLPELALEGILGRLPAAALCRLAAVCRELRKRCSSNHLWEALVDGKWGKVAGGMAFSEWELQFMACQRQQQQAGIISPSCRSSSTLWIWPLSCFLPVSWIRSCSCRRGKSSAAASAENSSADSFMAFYWDLETGRFKFPAQVYNRENGHVGFMLSCYDAEMSYNSASDSFLASFSYPPHGPRTSVYEEDVPWQRVRTPPVTTTAHELHVSDCLHELRPGDHIEVQWRRNKDFPYGWWYGIVGHDESCTGSNLLCQCHANKTVWLEFNQYSNGSRWRRAPINRDNHCEEGNDAEGYYGGLRKLRKEEISIWAKLWPNEKLE